MSKNADKQKPGESTGSLQQEKSDLKAKLHFQPDVSAIWIDRVQLTIRKDKQDGGKYGTLHCFQDLPPMNDEIQSFEVARIVTSMSHLHDVTRLLCRLLDYYPEREKGSET